jgi:hypothetical protein
VIRAAAFAALAVAIAAPSTAGALTITAQRILSDAERCNAHRLRLRSALIVAEVDVQVVSTFDLTDPEDLPAGEITLRPLTVLAGAAKTPLFRYTGSFYFTGSSEGYSLPQGKNIAFIYRDAEVLVPENFYLVSRERFDADANICRALGA